MTMLDPNSERPFTLPTLRDVLTPIFRYRVAGLLTAGCIIVLTIVAALLAPRQYVAEMRLLVKRDRPDAIFSVDPNATPQTRTEVTEDELNSEVELLRSPALLQQVAVAAGLVPPREAGHTDESKQATTIATARAAAEFRRNVTVKPLVLTRLIQVTYSAPDPQRALRALNELARLYLERHLAVHRQPGAYQFYSEQADRFREEVRLAEARLKAFGREEHIVSADVEREATLQKLADFEASLQETRGVIADTTQRLAELDAGLAATPARQTTQIRVSANGELVREMKSRILALEVKHAEMSRKFTPTYLPVLELEQELAQARAALASAEQTPLTESTSDQNPTHQWLRGELARTRTERVAAIARAGAIANSVRQYRDRAAQLDEKSAAQQDLRRVLKTAEENYILYTRKQEEARISDALDRTRIGNVVVADPPSVPPVPSSTARIWILLVGGIMALVLGVAVTYLLDCLSPYLRTPDEVEDALEVPVLASLAPRRKFGVPAFAARWR
jgi:uncharacterized protein involved in exopolysaccharide biosynthesis